MTLDLLFDASLPKEWIMFNLIYLLIFIKIYIIINVIEIPEWLESFEN